MADFRVTTLLTTLALGCPTPEVPPQAAAASDALILEGTARACKGGAVLVTDDGRSIYVAQLDTWPEGVEGQRVRAAGILGTEHYLPEAEQGEDGAWSQGIMAGSGPQLVLHVERWEVVTP